MWNPEPWQLRWEPEGRGDSLHRLKTSTPCLFFRFWNGNKRRDFFSSLFLLQRWHQRVRGGFFKLAASEMSKYTSFPEPMEDQNPFQVRDVRHEANVRVMGGWKWPVLAPCNSRRVVAHVTYFRACQILLSVRPLVALINSEHMKKWGFIYAELLCLCPVC